MKAIELTPEQPLDTVSDLGVRAEDAGFDTVFAACHYFNRDPFVALDRIAAATDHVRVGPAAANPYETHPVGLATRLATLQEGRTGRAVMGIGPGDRSTLSALGIQRNRPLRRVLETMQVTRKLLDGERVSHEGTFTADDVGLEYHVPTPPEIYVAAQGPDMVRMAAKHADGVLFNGSHPRDVEWAAERVAEGQSDRPEDRGPFDFAVHASVSVAGDETAAREAARPPVAFIAAGASDHVLSRHGLEHKRAVRIGESLARGAFKSAFGEVSDAMLDAFAIAGTVEQVAERMDAVLADADSLVVAAPLGPDVERAIDLAGSALDRIGAE